MGEYQKLVLESGDRERLFNARISRWTRFVRAFELVGIVLALTLAVACEAQTIVLIGNISKAFGAR